MKKIRNIYFYKHTKSLFLNGAKSVIGKFLMKRPTFGGYSYLVNFGLFAFSFCVISEKKQQQILEELQSQSHSNPDNNLRFTP